MASPHRHSFLLLLVCRRVLLPARVQQVALVQLAMHAAMAEEYQAPAQEVVKARGTVSTTLG